jgi:hypothetical protein
MITREEALLLMGTNSPKPHQRVIAALTAQLWILYRGGRLALEPLPETMLDESETSPTPDLILYDNVREETPVIIEITHTNGVNNDLKKVRRLIDETEYGIVEGFVYNYKKNEWHKYQKGVGDVLDRPSFCQAINLDLATLI